MYYISSSGGLGSMVSALLAHELGLPFALIFADTGIEDEDLYRALKDLERAVGKTHINLKDGRTPWDVYVDNRWIGNTRTAHCSQELKTDMVRTYLEKHGNYLQDVLVLGLDLDEKERLERAQTRWRPWQVISLLIDYKTYRPSYDEWLDKYDIKKPRLYGMGFTHNNCGGFCCKAGQGQFANLLRQMPERYKMHEEAMEEAMAKIGPTAKPFLRKQEKGITKYLTLKQFRIMIENGAQPDMHDYGGCGCFLDEEPTNKGE